MDDPRSPPAPAARPARRRSADAPADRGAGTGRTGDPSPGGPPGFAGDPASAASGLVAADPRPTSGRRAADTHDAATAIPAAGPAAPVASNTPEYTVSEISGAV